MTQENVTQTKKGNITLTWSDKPMPTAKAKAAAAPAPEQNEQPVAEDKDTPAAAPETETSPEQQPGIETTPQPAVEPTPQPENKKKAGWGAIFVDILLVLMLVGVIGGGAWYIHQQLNVYRVPSPMELAQAEYLELCKQHEQLQETAYQADEQLHLRERLTRLELQLAETRRQIDDHRRSLEIERNRVLAVQREIRQEDKASRGVARSMLIGMPIGHASRSNGKVYPDAVIHRLENGRISLRTSTGPVTFPLGQLVKDNLPDMARYALGIDDMVDMTDFTAEKGQAAPKQRKGKLIQPRKPSTRVTQPADYESETGAPVVNTEAPPTPILVEPGLTPEDDGSWQAPEGALPIGE